MQITDQQFISAMELAVKEKGGHNVAPGTYWSPTQGAYCIVGYALWKIKEDLCPKTNALLANDLLVKMGCSQRVAESAYAAQHANDMHMSWDECLDVFRFALEIWKPGQDLIGFIHRAVYTTRGRRVRMSEPAFPGTLYANGGIIHKVPDDVVMQSFNGACVAMTTSLSDLSMAFDKFASLTGTAKVATKKEHALVA
jgi:hypothetical protein